LSVVNAHSITLDARFFCRILNLFAEENAVEDTIYYLSESLRKEGLDLEVFLKVIIMLATLLLIIIRRTIYMHVALFQ